MLKIIIILFALSASSSTYAFTEGPVKFDNMIALMYTDDTVYTSRLLHLPQYHYSVVQIKGDNKLDFNKDFELRRYFLKPRVLVRLTPEYPISFFAVGEVEAFWNKFDLTVKSKTVTKQVE